MTCGGVYFGIDADVIELGNPRRGTSACSPRMVKASHPGNFCGRNRDMDGATFMGNAGIPCVPRPISRHSVVTGITDRTYLPAYEKPYRPLPALLLTLALMCENVNAAPQADMTGLSALPDRLLSPPAGAAPFMLSHPLCQTGFWIKQRVDDRDRDGIIIKSRWVFGCAKARIVYGRKV